MGCLRSLRAHQALDGVSWVQSGSVEVAVGGTSRVLQNRRRHLLPPSGGAPLGSSVRSPLRLRLLGYAGSNSVPCRNMACMITARRRASAILQLRDDALATRTEGRRRRQPIDVEKIAGADGGGPLIIRWESDLAANGLTGAR